MTDPICNPENNEYCKVDSYTGDPYDMRRVYNDEEIKRFYSPFFPSIEDLLKW